MNLFADEISKCKTFNSIDVLKICAESGDIISQYNLGVSYRDGTNIQQDFEKAFYWINKSAKQNLLEAKLNLAWFYETGLGVKQDKLFAFKYVEDLANQGYPLALNNLGKYYQEGIGVVRNLEKSIELYQAAIEKGGLDIAYINLSYSYFYGLGIAKDPDKAINILTRLSDQGNELAMANLGAFYKYLGIYDKAIFWTEKAAKKNNSLAQTNLGFLYAKGIGVKMDSHKANYWLNRAMAQNNSQAFFIMGTLYNESNSIFGQDQKKAFELYYLSAKMGNGNAQNNLATRLFNGKGVDKNEKEGLKWYLKAASENNVIPAMYALYQIYSKGTKDIPQDLEKAKYWIEKARENGINE